MTATSSVPASPIALAFVTALLLGLAIVVAQRGVRAVATLPGAAVANISSLLTLLIFAPWFWSSAGATSGSLAIFVLVGLFFPGGVTLLMLESNRRLGPSMTASIAGTTPLFAWIAAVVFLGEAFVETGLIGTAAIVAGIATLAWRRGGMPGRIASLAALLPLASAVIRAGAQVLTKFALAIWPSPFAAIFIAYIASSLVTSTLCRLRGERIPWRPALGWFALSGAMNAIGTLALYTALEQGDVTVIAPIAATGPLVTLAASALILREEKLTLRLAAGVAITLVGVTLILVR
jgi:drug/metabolite transporter (DMT)-like permease